MKIKQFLSQKYYLVLLAFLISFGFQSCKYYTQDYLFQTDGDVNTTVAAAARKSGDLGYVLSVHDLIDLKVYTNRGEMLVDPNSELGKQIGGGALNKAQTEVNFGGGIMGSSISSSVNAGLFEIYSDGYALLPLIGKIKLAGLSCRQADSLLNIYFSKYYEEPYCIIRPANRRAYIFGISAMMGGAIGGAGGASVTMSKAVILETEHESIFEVISKVGGIPAFAKVSKIKIIRGNLSNPEVIIIDIHTLKGITQSDLFIQPNDIIYIEPGRRPTLEFLKDYSVLFTFATSVITLILLINR